MQNSLEEKGTFVKKPSPKHLTNIINHLAFWSSRSQAEGGRFCSIVEQYVQHGEVFHHSYYEACFKCKNRDTRLYKINLSYRTNIHIFTRVPLIGRTVIRLKGSTSSRRK
ncbi:hypothetical protein AMECASPLE_009031 [Ameca splendens]|uniref:Uncharacterized protein n=1 Tax=Ameca splendens TaxID=208324 RepID=A0ABV1A7A8_9TELE